jgi:uncharacterized protein
MRRIRFETIIRAAAVTALCLALLLCAAAVAVSANDNLRSDEQSATDTDLSYVLDSNPELVPLGHVNDELGLLTQSQRQSFEQRLKALSDKYNMDFVVWTTQSAGNYDSERIDRADRYLEDFSDRTSGVLFMYEEDSTYKYISTMGDDCIKAVPDAYVEAFLDDICDKYDGHGGSHNDFAGAVEAFISDCDFYCGYYAEHGTVYTPPKGPMPVGRNAIIAGVVALLVAAVMKSKEAGRLNSVRPAVYAGDYVVPNSLNVYGGSDLFLYSTVSKVARSSSSSGGGGGGMHSTTHHSSSGVSHGGGGRH